MIHDATVEVTCDNEYCGESIFVKLDSGILHYDTDDAKVEKRLVDDHGWQVKDGQHYCSGRCAGESEWLSR